MRVKAYLCLLLSISFSEFVFGMQQYPAQKRVTLSRYRTSQLAQPAPVQQIQEKLISDSNDFYTFPNSSKNRGKPEESKIDFSCFSGDDQAIIYSLYNGKIKLCNLELSNAHLLLNASARAEYVFDLHGSRLAMLLHTKDYNTVEIYDLSSEKSRTFALNKRKLVNIYVSPDRSALFLRYKNLNEIEEKICIVEANSNSLMQSELLANEIDLIAISPSAQQTYLAIIDLVNKEHKLKIYDYLKYDNRTQCIEILESNLDFKANIVEFSRDGKSLVLLSDKGILKILNLETKETCSFKLENFENVYSIKFLPNQAPHFKDNCILIISNDGTMSICDLQNSRIFNKAMLFHAINGKTITSASLSNDGQHLLITIEKGQTNKLKIFDLTKMVKKQDTTSL